MIRLEHVRMQLSSCADLLKFVVRQGRGQTEFDPKCSNKIMGCGLSSAHIPTKKAQIRSCKSQNLQIWMANSQDVLGS